MKKYITLISSVLLLSSCNVAPEDIAYGKDACSFCDMTIVDKTHAAEYVTNKGRAYKFDAIECLINDLSNKDENEMAFILVTDFLNPTVLIDVKETSFLISEEIKSPMGANLSAFKNKNRIDYKGAIYNWKSIKEVIRK